MSDVEKTDSRLEELEIRSAHQEAQIDELNKALFDHWQMIDALTKKIKHLSDKVAIIDERVPSNPGEDPPPPHY